MLGGSLVAMNRPCARMRISAAMFSRRIKIGFKRGLHIDLRIWA